jgi:hypothetical protein
LFGNAAQVRFEDTLVTDTFTRCAPVVMHWPWRSAMFKTLYKNNGLYQKLGVHRPRKPDETRLSEARWFDGEGRELDDQFKTRRIFSNYGRSNYALVQLNHYPLGAMESYVLKADRGRAVHSDDLLGLDYWTERNWNTDEDLSIQRYSPEKEAQLRMLKAGFDALMEQEPFRALFGRLLMSSPARPITPQAARFMVTYANRARSRDG